MQIPSCFFVCFFLRHRVPLFHITSSILFQPSQQSHCVAAPISQTGSRVTRSGPLSRQGAGMTNP